MKEIRHIFLGFVLAAALGAQACVERAGLGSASLEPNSHSHSPSLSEDGRWIAFASDASNLVPGDGNIVADIFVRDRRTDATTRVSVASNGAQMSPWLAGGVSPVGASAPSLSADGRWVAFTSFGADLVPGDTNGKQDVFVHDRLTGITERVSVSSTGLESNADAFLPMISADGRRVAWQSAASTLVVGDVNGLTDVFLRDRTTGITTRVSTTPAGQNADGASSGASLSSDGTRIAFTSSATNLVVGDTNGAPDVFVHDTTTGTTTRVSVGAGGVQATGSASGSGDAMISADGGSVAFRSHATNLVVGDGNGAADIFVRTLASGTTVRASLTFAGGQAAGASASGAAGSFVPKVSRDGRFVAFVSHATNLAVGDGNGQPDVFLRDTAAGTTLRLGVDGRGAGIPTGTGLWGSTFQVALSADGLTVAFPSSSPLLVEGDLNGACDVFVNTARPRLVAATNAPKGAPFAMSLDGPGDAAGNFYVVALSAATTPGIPLGAGRVLPLADDAILGASLTPGVSAFVGFQGVLGASGTGSATLAVPNLASLVGVPFHAAFVILDGGYAYGLRAVSPAHTFTITN